MLSCKLDCDSNTHGHYPEDRICLRDYFIVMLEKVTVQDDLSPAPQKLNQNVKYDTAQNVAKMDRIAA